MKPTALPVELLRCWEWDDKDGKHHKESLMLRRDVPQFRTEFFSRAMQIFNTWRLFEKAPPSGNGWANERNVTCTILTMLEVENNKWDAWQRDLEEAKRKK